MKVKPLKHKDLVNLAVHELNQGSKLNKVEKDLHEMGIERTEALKAIEEADYYKKQEEELKAKKEAESKEQQTQAAGHKETAPQSKEKSSFWLWLILIAAIGTTLYLYFSGIINPIELIKNFK